MRISQLDHHETRVIARLVELLAPSVPALDAATRAAVLSDVSTFVEAQIAAMPTFLRLPYRGALVAFNWLAVLRYRRTFVGLRDEAAARYLGLWSDRGLGVTRDFVKLIRSCALLAYFDDPRVRAGLQASKVPAPSPQRAVGNGLD